MNAIDYFLEWLEGYLNFEHNPKKNIFWLDTIDYLCKRFDNPQDFAHCFHVAGSKGKGSVSRMISCILEEAGFNVGIYSSPHITDFRERICKPDGFFDEKIYEAAIKEMVPNIDSIIPTSLPAERPITWFELVTLYGFLCFRQAKVDWAVYEVGMGGRLDSTNVIRPKLCCITPIELEHTEFLGDTIEKIASEKAGIIKNCTPVVISKQNYEEAKIVFREKAITRHAPYYFVDELTKNLSYNFDTEKKKMKIHFESEIFNRPIETDMSLLGSMQLENACMAAIAVRKILPNLSEEVIERGLAKAKLPGRFEILENIKGFEGISTLILDGAHTLNSIKLTLDTLNKLYENEKVDLLFACAADKDIKDISKALQYRFNHVYITKPGDVKHSDLQSADEAFKNAEIDYELNADYKAMINKALSTASQEGNHLLVTGSFYLLAEVFKFLGK
ncbi:MAG: folylpolyglutamate synthase/dihydrofolate synthase family protein [Treponema sp.]|nr:folylpolyglutamate synthase/dihydrofolate synthase family protein [Treponema sp.]